MKNLKPALFIYILLISFAAQAQQKQVKLLKNTNWIQEGYGRGLKIADSTFTYYNLDRLNCKSLAEGKLNGRFKIISLNKNELVLNPGGIVNYVFKKVPALPGNCGSTPPSTASYEDNFKIFWETFNDNYAFFKERNVDWQQVYKEYLPKAKQANSPKELSVILTALVKQLGDGHIRLEIPDSLQTKTPATSTGVKRKTNDVIQGIKDKYLENVHVYNHGVLSWGKLKDSNTGYIIINDMNNFANYLSPEEQALPTFLKKYEEIKDLKPAMEQFDDEIKGVDTIMKKVFADLGKTDSIVIDLRFNGGGLETVALRLLSYFVGESKPVITITAKTVQGNTKKQTYVQQSAKANYKGKVFLLTGPNTASAAEIFALSARSYPNITSIGTRTNGIFSEILWKELPIGWEFSLSNEIYMDRSGKTYEGIGVPVHIELNYPRNRFDFYHTFYNGDQFSDAAIDRISKTK